MTPPNHSQLRLLPAVERLLNLPTVTAISSRFGRDTVKAWIRDVLSDLRSGKRDVLTMDASNVEAYIVDAIETHARRAEARQLGQVINGTGIVIHTNLGRAPLARAAVVAMTKAAACTNLEVDLATGHRGRRGAAVELLCQEITGAEAALIVNNCAAATLLTLQTFAAGRRVLISRGQLIEIGGSFRLPDVFRQAGVQLHEVGTTNRTRLSDYAEAVGPDTAAILRVHPSNYQVTGFCESVAISELADLAKSKEITVIDDVGSGCLYDLTRYGLSDEPIVGDSLRAGADLVIFSGDKLLGGPQCGLILGRFELVERLRSNPLARALRVDKLILAGLQATLELHRAGRAFAEIPVLQQLTSSAEAIRSRAEGLLKQLRARSDAPHMFSLLTVASAPGGGTLPGREMPSYAIAISTSNADHLAARLRLGNPAVFPRVQEGMTMVDLRTVMPEDDDLLLGRILDSAQE